MKPVIAQKDLAERWGLSTDTIRNYVQRGKLHQLPKFEKPTFAMAEVLEFESYKDGRIISVRERALEMEVAELKAENQSLWKRIYEAMGVFGMTIGGSKIV